MPTPLVYLCRRALEKLRSEIVFVAATLEQRRLLEDAEPRYAVYVDGEIC